MSWWSQKKILILATISFALSLPHLNAKADDGMSTSNGVLKSYNGIRINADGSVTAQTTGKYQWSRTQEKDEKTKRSTVTLWQKDPATGRDSKVKLYYFDREGQPVLSSVAGVLSSGKDFFHVSTTNGNSPTSVTKCQSAGLCYSATKELCGMLMRNFGTANIDDLKSNIQSCLAMPKISQDGELLLELEAGEAKEKLAELSGRVGAAANFIGRKIFESKFGKTETGVPALSLKGSDEINAGIHYRAVVDLCSNLDHQAWTSDLPKEPKVRAKERATER